MTHTNKKKSLIKTKVTQTKRSSRGYLSTEKEGNLDHNMKFVIFRRELRGIEKRRRNSNSTTKPKRASNKAKLLQATCPRKGGKLEPHAEIRHLRQAGNVTQRKLKCPFRETPVIKIAQ